MGHIGVDQDRKVYEDQEVLGGAEVYYKERDGSHFGLFQEKSKYVMRKKTSITCAYIMCESSSVILFILSGWVT